MKKQPELALRFLACHDRDVDRLTDPQIAAALQRLNEKLAEANERAQVYLVGGAVMCLVLKARTSTKDVDAWFTEPEKVRAAARKVAEELSLPEHWLNDAAKAFVPEAARFEAWRAFSNLEVLAADVRTMLAMKCAAARTAEDSDDIRFLAHRLGLTKPSEVLKVVLAFFPADRLPVRAKLLIEEMFDDGA